MIDAAHRVLRRLAEGPRGVKPTSCEKVNASVEIVDFHRRVNPSSEIVVPGRLVSDHFLSVILHLVQVVETFRVVVDYSQFQATSTGSSTN
jgi:hypothetical protein